MTSRPPFLLVFSLLGLHLLVCTAVLSTESSWVENVSEKQTPGAVRLAVAALYQAELDYLGAQVNTPFQQFVDKLHQYPLPGGTSPDGSCDGNVWMQYNKN